MLHIFNPVNTEFRSEKNAFSFQHLLLDRFSTSTEISMEMAKWLISQWSAMKLPEPPSLFSEHSKWFARICEGAKFAWRTTASLSRTWNLFLLDERKSNRGIRMCCRNSQLKIKLTFNTRKGYYTNQFLLKQWQVNFNLQFVYAALKYASQLGFLIGDTRKYKLHNEYASVKLVIAFAKCQRAKMLPIRARC